MRIKLLSGDRIIEFSHKLTYIIQFLIVLIVITNRNLTAFAYKFLNFTFPFEKFGIYNLILEDCSVKLRFGIYIFIVVCWELAIGNFLAGSCLIVFKSVCCLCVNL